MRHGTLKLLKCHVFLLSPIPPSFLQLLLEWFTNDAISLYKLPVVSLKSQETAQFFQNIRSKPTLSSFNLSCLSVLPRISIKISLRMQICQFPRTLLCFLLSGALPWLGRAGRRFRLFFLSKLVAGNLGSFSAPKDCYFDEWGLTVLIPNATPTAIAIVTAFGNWHLSS